MLFRKIEQKYDGPWTGFFSSFDSFFGHIDNKLTNYGLKGGNSCSNTNEWIATCMHSDELKQMNEDIRESGAHMGMFYKFGLHYLLHGDVNNFLWLLFVLKICRKPMEDMVDGDDGLVRYEIKQMVLDMRETCLRLHVWPLIAASTI
jgi:hypothetical protein